MIINQIHKKIVKGGGGDLSDLGSTVKVQATDNFSVGDTFVGTAVSGMTPTVVRVKSGFASVGHISADSSVALSSTTISATSTYITIYIKNEDVYTEVIVPLPDMTGGSNSSSTKISINEDGTIIIVNMLAFLLKISVAKESLTATADRIEPSSVSLSQYPYTDSSGSYAVTPVDFTSNKILVRGSYLFFSVKSSYTKGTSTSTTTYGMYGRIAGSSITHEYKLNGSTTVAYCSGVNSYGENDLIFVRGSSYLHRFEIFGGDIVKANDISQNATYITQNGKYLCYNTNVYRINQETGTCSLIKTAANQPTAVDETGEYLLISSKCYLFDGTNLGSANNPVGSSYFKIVDDSYIDSSYNIATLVPSEGAQYTIAHAKSTSIAGDIYGVVSEEMTVGEIKDAQKLFNA